MKLRPIEALFFAVCLVGSLLAIAAVYFYDSRSEGISVYSTDNSSDTDQDIASSDYSEPYNINVLNAATLQDFMEISGIGEVKASEIIAYRDALGGFSSTDQLLDVNGISDVLYRRILDYFYSAPSVDNAALVTEPVTEADDTKYTTAAPSETEVTIADSVSAPNTAVDDNDISAETAPDCGSWVVEGSDIEDLTDVEVMSERQQVNVNTATADEIAWSLQIDSELADEIVALRGKIGRISTVQEIYLYCDIDGKTYRAIKDYIVFN